MSDRARGRPLQIERRRRPLGWKALGLSPLLRPEQRASHHQSTICLDAVRRVAVMRLDGVGDYVLFTPVLRELRRSLPQISDLALVTTPAVAELARRSPYVDTVIEVSVGSGVRTPGTSSKSQALRQLWAFEGSRRSVRAFDPDLAIVPRWDVDTYHASLLAWLSGAPRRLGFCDHRLSDLGPRRRPYDIFMTTAMKPGGEKHEVLRNLGMLRNIGVDPMSLELELSTSIADSAFAAATLARIGFDAGGMLVALGIGARDPKRRWSPNGFRAVARWLVDTYRARVVVIGAPAEGRLGSFIAKGMGSSVVSLVGRCTIPETAALLAKCSLFVGNDSGPMHLAAAGKSAVVELSCHPRDGAPLHPNDPARFGPWGVPHRVARPDAPLAPCVDSCSSTQSHCIALVTVSRVQQAVEDLVGPCRT